MKVAGFKPRRVDTQEDMLAYCPEWSLNAAMEMIDLLQTNIRASVVVRNSPRFLSALLFLARRLFFIVVSASAQACEPELEVLLYDMSGELLHLPLIRKGLAERD